MDQMAQLELHAKLLFPKSSQLASLMDQMAQPELHAKLLFLLNQLFYNQVSHMSQLPTQLLQLLQLPTTKNSQLASLMDQMAQPELHAKLLFLLNQLFYNQVSHMSQQPTQLLQ